MGIGWMEGDWSEMKGGRGNWDLYIKREKIALKNK